MISVIVPAYNAAHFLAETILSVVSQTMPDWELVVVDDGSADETSAIAEDFAHGDERIRLIRQKNAGPSLARNCGFLASSPTSDFVIFLDADDILHPESFQTLSSSLVTHSEMIGVHGVIRLIDAAGSPLAETQQSGTLYTGLVRKGIQGSHVVEWLPENPTTFAVLAYSCAIVTPGVCLLRRSAVTAVGGFDPRADHVEDWDFWIRLCRRGDILFLPEVILDHRRHGTNYSSDLQLRITRSGYSIWKAYVCPENTQEQHDVMLAAIAHYLSRNLPRQELTQLADIINHAC